MMALRSAVILLLLALTLVAESSAGAIPDAGWGPAASIGGGRNTCVSADTPVGDCVDESEELGLESESARRSLGGRGRGGRGRFISYGALEKNSVPCNRRGQSYYNCNRQGRANPYNRGCTAITRCARVTN